MLGLNTVRPFIPLVLGDFPLSDVLSVLLEVHLIQ